MSKGTRVMAVVIVCVLVFSLLASRGGRGLA